MNLKLYRNQYISFQLNLQLVLVVTLRKTRVNGVKHLSKTVTANVVLTVEAILSRLLFLFISGF